MVPRTTPPMRHGRRCREPVKPAADRTRISERGSRSGAGAISNCRGSTSVIVSRGPLCGISIPAARLKKMAQVGMEIAGRAEVLTEQDIYLFKEGTYFGSYEK